MLAAHFDRVVGSDGSVAQLRAATRAPRVDYLASLAETAGLRSGRVDLVTVAQAFHWIDAPRFYAEVARVAAAGAALAIWGYARLQASAPIEALIHRFHDDTVGPYWPKERKLVEEGYRSFEIPIHEVPAPGFAIEAVLTLPELLGYLRTWSAVGKYFSERGTDPVELLEPDLAACWGEPTIGRQIKWPVFVRAGRWR